jgi:hypothetical protein
MSIFTCPPPKSRALGTGLLVILSLVLLPACGGGRGGGGGGGGGDDDSADDDDDDGRPTTCTEEGATTCFVEDFMVCADGLWEVEEECREPTDICHPQLGCLLCNPAREECIGNAVVTCNDDGSDYTIDLECDLDQVCIAGSCRDACDVARSRQSYLGCEFLAISTTNLVGFQFDDDFAVVVGNPASNPEATVIVSRGGTQVTTTTLGPGQARAISLPMVLELKGATTESVTVRSAAYEITTSVPVAAYQYNPLNFVVGGTNSFSNDASLLLPEHVLGEDYMVSSLGTSSVGQWGTGTSNSWFDFVPGFIAVAATEDGTTVTITTTARTAPGNPASMSPGQSTTVSLDRGDVVQILSNVPVGASRNPSQNYCRSQGWEASTDSCFTFTCEFCLIPDTDLTGSVITSSAPVAVVSGHQCSMVPFDQWACDHLEEMMFPTGAWGTLSVMTAPIHPDGGFAAPTQYRVLALNNGTDVSFDPPVASGRTLSAGEFMQFETDDDFVVEGSDKIHVTQYLQGQNALGSELAGDPAMGSGIPWSQVRSEYEFLTPSSYEVNYLNVVRPAGDEVSLDGSPITQWEAVGSTGYEVARIQVQPGSHSITARNEVGFGITSYGYARYTSYLFPGGMNFGR